MNWQFSDNYKHKGQRSQLVNTVRQKGIQDERILQAIGKIPRHFFMNSAFENFAYQDKPFPIGEGQTISQPYTVAKQTELLEVSADQKVLEIGTGSGYQSIVLLELGVQLFSVELHQKLHKNADFLIKKLGYTQAKLLCGDGSLGWEAHAPYDRIIVTAGAPTVPQSLLQQLKIGGILIIPVGDDKTQTMLKIIKQSEDSCTKKDLGNFSFVPLVGKEGW